VKRRDIHPEVDLWRQLQELDDAIIRDRVQIEEVFFAVADEEVGVVGDLSRLFHVLD